MHAAATDVGLAVSGGRIGARGDGGLLFFNGGALGLVEGGRRDEVLDDCGVAGKLVCGRGAALGCRLRDDGLQDGGLTRFARVSLWNL